ncbi:MAG: TIGR02530 family flagellar biosynthesis protein [Halanaerobiales bacterium]
MDDRMIINQPLSPTRQTGKPVKKNNQQTSNKSSFKKIIADKIKDKTGIKFSKHAQNRIVSRNINLNDNQLRQLQKGVEKLEDKGARDSLVMINDVAYVVSVENKTVITAIDEDNVKENVFTNIDSAVFM